MNTGNFKFLILGAGRGGTSLLAGLLDYHPELTVAFEMYSVAYLMGKKLPYQGPNLFDQRVNAFLDACNKAANQQPNSIWGNKITTEQIFGLEDHNKFNLESKIDIFDSLFNNYLKNIKVIFILRDGRTCINSKVQRTGQPIEEAARRWQYSVQCYKFFKTHHTNNFCVRFEDILLDPKENLSNICSFLNITYNDDMLLGTNNEKMLPEYRINKFDHRKTKSIYLPDEILLKIQNDLGYCGYLENHCQDDILTL